MGINIPLLAANAVDVAAEAEAGINVVGPKIIFKIAGLNITETIINQWIVIIIIMGLVLFLTHNMEVTPRRRRQQLAEYIYDFFTNNVYDNMGRNYARFIPYIGALFMMSILGSLVSLIGLRSVTADYSVTLTWAVITFVMIQTNAIYHKKLSGYAKGFFEPVPFLAPLNVVSEFITPISMSFRHFGNISAGMIISMLVYFGLSHIHPIAQVGIPAVLSLYFDLFGSFIQAFIFIMLTMCFVANAQD